MKSRVLTALVGIGLVVPTLFYGGPLALELIVAVALGIAVLEYRDMVLKKRPGAVSLGLTGGAFYVAVLYGPPGSAAAVAALSALVLFSQALLQAQNPHDGMRHAADLVLGWIWIFGLAVHFPLVRRMDSGLEWILLMLAVIWGGDAGAFLTGRSFGKRKLYESISPNKTWEGAYGSLVASVLAALVAGALFLPEVGKIHLVVLGLLLSVAAVVGDLFESLVKRAAGAKDSGTLFPGHGGMLDRLDSLLFGIVVVYLYVQCMGL
jgi:phosphatidate cytidylyltransferase